MIILLGRGEAIEEPSEIAIFPFTQGTSVEIERCFLL